MDEDEFEQYMFAEDGEQWGLPSFSDMTHMASNAMSSFMHDPVGLAKEAMSCAKHAMSSGSDIGHAAGLF